MEVESANLAPADRRKEGPAFELPIALGLLAATENLRISGTSRYAIVGELALDGRVRSVQGCLPMALRAREVGLDGFIVPIDNAREAAIVTGLHVVPVSSLREAVGFLAGTRPLEPMQIDHENLFRAAQHSDMDMAEVQGQHQVKRALEVAAGGGHNALMLYTILPRPSQSSALSFKHVKESDFSALPSDLLNSTEGKTTATIP